MMSTRIKECVGLMMVGEGLLAAMHPHGYARLWESGPKWWRGMIGPLVRNPNMTRLIGVTEAAVGYWIATRQLPDFREGSPRPAPAESRLTQMV